MTRKKLIAGNWKSYKTPRETKEFIEMILPEINTTEVDVLFCVPAIDIVPALQAAEGTALMIGAENMNYKDEGAYTGETAPRMLKDSGCTYVIIGHSERRQYYGETDETVNLKLLKAYEYGINPIVCVGETLAQREIDITKEWLRMQIKKAFAGIKKEDAGRTVVAYEPLWAIGTGRNASPEQAEEGCKCIRDCLAELYDTETAEKIRILYGGSVNAGNAAALFAMPDIDGGLVGGASLKPEFASIVNYKDKE